LHRRTVLCMLVSCLKFLLQGWVLDAEGRPLPRFSPQLFLVIGYYTYYVNCKVDVLSYVCHVCFMDTERKPFPVRLNDEDLQKVDDLRRVEPDIPTRPEMIRRLIDRAHTKGKFR